MCYIIDWNFFSFSADYFKDYYEAPWCRIGPYIVGIVTGYLLAAKRNSYRFTWVSSSLSGLWC